MVDWGYVGDEGDSVYGEYGECYCVDDEGGVVDIDVGELFVGDECEYDDECLYVVVGEFVYDEFFLVDVVV